MKYSVHIIDKATKEVVETVPCKSERDVQSIVRGVRMNLNHAEFKVEIVEEKACGDCSTCVK